MEVIRARNVNDAYFNGLQLLRSQGRCEKSRAGDVMVMPCPVTIVYERPMERILWDATRNANPFFHLAESLWMLAGRNDATWLDQFVGDFSSRFAEAGGRQHGAYGYRWRQQFGEDQLNRVVALLSQDPRSRQVVLTMWDPVVDLGAVKKDLPCNTHVYFRVREIDKYKCLDITVCCRSNDIVWGAYGANAVHFAVLQEYIAVRLGCRVGRYYQISNNYHAYLNTMPDDIERTVDLYTTGTAVASPMFEHSYAVDQDIRVFFAAWEKGEQRSPKFYNTFLSNVAWPMLKLYEHRNALTTGQLQNIADMLSLTGDDPPKPSLTDWEWSCIGWLQRRIDKREKKHVGSK